MTRSQLPPDGQFSTADLVGSSPMRPPASDERKVSFTVRLPEDILVKFREVAERSGWTQERLALYAFIRVVSDRDEIVEEAKRVQTRISELRRQAVSAPDSEQSSRTTLPPS